MESNYSRIDINSYVAKYMDDMGCSLDQACDDLEIDKTEVFKSEISEETY